MQVRFPPEDWNYFESLSLQQEMELLQDLLEGGKLKNRVDTKTDDKLAQKVRLKSMLLADQIHI